MERPRHPLLAVAAAALGALLLAALARGSAAASAQPARPDEIVWRARITQSGLCTGDICYYDVREVSGRYGSVTVMGDRDVPLMQWLAAADGAEVELRWTR